MSAPAGCGVPVRRWWELRGEEIAARAAKLDAQAAKLDALGEQFAREYAYEVQWMTALRLEWARDAWREHIDDLDAGYLPIDLAAISLRGDCGCPLTNRECRAPTGPRVSGCLARPA